MTGVPAPGDKPTSPLVALYIHSWAVPRIANHEDALNSKKSELGLEVQALTTTASHCRSAPPLGSVRTFVGLILLFCVGMVHADDDDNDDSSHSTRPSSALARRTAQAIAWRRAARAATEHRSA